MTRKNTEKILWSSYLFELSTTVTKLAINQLWRQEFHWKCALP